MPLHHVALFRWQPEATPEQIAAVTPALQALAATLSGVRSYACGASTGATPTAYDYGVIAEFEDKAAWDVYMADEEHDRIRSELIAPIVAERAGIQLDA